MKPYFLVCQVTFSDRLEDIDAARQEAAQAARTHPGIPFVILEAIAEVQAGEVPLIWSGPSPKSEAKPGPTAEDFAKLADSLERIIPAHGGEAFLARVVSENCPHPRGSADYKRWHAEWAFEQDKTYRPGNRTCPRCARNRYDLRPDDCGDALCPQDLAAKAAE